MIIRVKNRKYDFFNSLSVNLKYDAIASTFSFKAEFNPNNEDQVELLHVGHFHTAIIEDDGDVLITGPILSNTFTTSKVVHLVGIGGYSLTGVLEDCNIPVSLYPLQSDGLNLLQIAQKLVEPFKLKIVVDSVVSALVNKVYTNTTAGEQQTIKQYLTELASQRNIILSHTRKGELLFTKAKTNQSPIIRIEPGGHKFSKMTMVFNGQAMHSDITVQKQADSDGGSASEATIKNPFVPFVFRSKVVSQSSGDDNDVNQAARNALSAELKNLTLTIELDSFRVDGNLIEPNNIVSVIDPNLMIFKKTNFFIEEVTFTGDPKREVSTLKCVLPSVYDDSKPVNIFE